MSGHAEVRIPELDGIRGLAIGSVLIWHYLVGSVQAPLGSFVAYCQKLLSFSWAGVDLFFVLSGFLIGGILLDQRQARNYFRAFFSRRVTRIVPVYLVVVFLFLVGQYLSVGSMRAGLVWLFSEPFPAWTYLAYVQNLFMAWEGTFGASWLSATWSLAIEEQFYLILPLLVRFVSLRWLPGVLAALVVGAPIARIALYESSARGGLAGYLLLPTRWDALFLGVLGALALRSPMARVWLASHVRTIWWVWLSCGALLAVLLVRGQGIGSMGMAYGGHTLLAVLALSTILLGIQTTAGPLKGLLCNPWLIWLGSVSYGIYLFHLPVLGLLQASLLDGVPHPSTAAKAAVIVLALVSTCSLAAISWGIFERPLVRLGRRVRYD